MNQNTMDYGSPEDSGDGLFDKASVVEALLAPPDSLEHALINGRLARQDAYAMIEMYQTGLQFRQPQILQEINLKIVATTGEGGQGRIEASSAVQGSTNVKGYEVMESKRKGFFGRFRRNKKPDNLDE